MKIKTLRACAFFLISIQTSIFCMHDAQQASLSSIPSGIAPFSPTSFDLSIPMPELPLIQEAQAMEMPSYQPPVTWQTNFPNYGPLLEQVLTNALQATHTYSIKEHMASPQTQQFICNYVTGQFEQFLYQHPQISQDIAQQIALFATREAQESAHKRIQITSQAQQELIQELCKAIAGTRGLERIVPLSPAGHDATLIRAYAQRITPAIIRLFDTIAHATSH